MLYQLDQILFLFENIVLTLSSWDAQIEDIVRAAKRACYRAVPMAATAWVENSAVEKLKI